jgi:ABC-type transporter MlaC component
MTSLLSKLSVVVAVFSLLCAARAEAQESGGPEAVIREFYSWYVKAVAANRDPFTEESAKLKQYATARFIRQIQKARDGEEMSFDPFLHAQDVDKAWAKNITVAKPQIKGDVATANVELKGPEMGAHKLAVTLREEGGAWKVDKVAAK